MTATRPLPDRPTEPDPNDARCTLPAGECRICPAGRVLDLAADLEPGTWVAVNGAGDLRIVVPKGPQGQYTLAHPHPAQTQLALGGEA